ncbi:hypothetical protein ACIQUB_16885 [Rhizobium sp. NPDC090275]|uniref:hypothetical protein n=1 Tax=Rhizobium sp. NPDC090275 TaxID=3364498 RepID=UPI00383A2285
MLTLVTATADMAVDAWQGIMVPTTAANPASKPSNVFFPFGINNLLIKMEPGARPVRSDPAVGVLLMSALA